MDTVAPLAGLWRRRPPHAGKLGHHIDRFAHGLVKQGYCNRSARRSASVVAGFGCWLERKKLHVSDIDEGTLQQYYRSHFRNGDSASFGAHEALHGFLFMLREAEVCRAKPPTAPATPSSRLIDDFRRFLVQQRGLRDVKTIERRMLIARHFLEDRCGGDVSRLTSLTGDDATCFARDMVRKHAANGRSSVYISSHCSALRTFLGYLRFRGAITHDLAACVPKIAGWRHATLPKFIGADQVRRVLRHCDRKTARGKRDYAILLLLSRLGLRANEITRLLLDDVDWDAGQLNVRGKGFQRQQMPLPAQVGEAIADYLRQGRPKSVSRRVFLRHKAPDTGFLCSGGVSSVAMRALKRAGVITRGGGSHVFRHTLATEMLRSGVTLREISQVLRHKSEDTTRIYAKVDFEALRPLALPWPGDAS